MADVATNVKGTTERNGSYVVGAPKCAKTDALGSKYISTPGDTSDMTTKGAIGGVNDATQVAQLEAQKTTRFDDVRYYEGDSAS